MRGLIITLILFVILISIVIINSFYVNNIINGIKNEITTLKLVPCEENAIIIKQIKSDWEKDSILISLSVGYEDIEELTDMIVSLEASNSAKDYNQFKLYYELLLNSIEEIGRLEKFSVKNIL